MTIDAYQRLEKKFKTLSLLGDAEAVLSWDQAVMMPKGSGEARGEQLAALAVMRHEMLTSVDIGDLLAKAQSDDVWQQANLAEMRRQYNYATAIPEDLVEAKSLAASKCEGIWRGARENSDFEEVRPALEEVVNLTLQEATALSEALQCSPYDAVLGKYEPGGRIDEIDVIFDSYRTFLPDFLEQVLAKQTASPAPVQPEGPFDLDTQEALGREVCEMLGFDFDKGRLDVSTHPFTGGTPDDVRLTTRYSETEFITALMGTIHETGHGLYEAGLPAKWRGQPVGQSRGMVVHESQSLIMEMQASRSPAFLQFFAKKLADTFNGQGAAWGYENIKALYHKVEPGFIRVDADEVTYPAHVILRTDLEKALVSGEAKVADLPELWNDGLEKLLGIRPSDDSQGVLQDIHWFAGLIGYFPTYSLGAMTAAQLFAAAQEKLADLNGDLAKGDFSNLLTWLRDVVHKKASSTSTTEIVRQATGKPLDPEIFKAHLRARYLEAA